MKTRLVVWFLSLCLLFVVFAVGGCALLPLPNIAQDKPNLPQDKPFFSNWTWAGVRLIPNGYVGKLVNPNPDGKIRSVSILVRNADKVLLAYWFFDENSDPQYWALEDGKEHGKKEYVRNHDEEDKCWECHKELKKFRI